jgi:hypothetical protein
MPKLRRTNYSTSIEEAIDTINDWVTVEEFCTLFPNIPEKTIRWQLTSRQGNGLNPCVQLIGKQRYVSIQGYAAWLKSGVSYD